MNDDLRAWAADRLGVAVDGARQIGSGASRQIWRLDTSRGPFVLRVDPGTGPVAGTPLDLAREAAVYGALNGSGLPVPALLAASPTALLMEMCAGAEALAMEADGRRAAVGRDYLHWLGRLHTLDAAALPLTFLGDASELDLWAGIAATRTAGWETPAVAPALYWLGGALPEIVEAVLCHGDAGPGNFLYDGDRVSALLDWEFAHLGDPHDDLAWVFVRNHLLGRPIDVPDALDAWRAVTGLDVDRGAIERYRVLVLVRMAISCDATLAWKGGLEDDSTRTQVLLRPWLGAAIPTALGLAGCDAPWLTSLEARGDAELAASPHAPLLALIPPLEPIP